MGLPVPRLAGPLSGAPQGEITETHDMEFFVRYFVELELPVAAVEEALSELPKEWFLAMANKAHARALGFMLEADPVSDNDVAGEVVELSIEPATHHRSTAIREMAWALIGPHSAKPLLEADLEVGSLGHRRSQLAVAGRYFVPGAAWSRRVDRGIAQRVGEATIKGFVDELANAVVKVALGVPALRLPIAHAPGWPFTVV